MAKANQKSGYDPVPQESGARSPNSEKLAGITSYWAQMTNTKETRPRYNIGKHGIMGEIGHWTLPILFRWRASLWKTVWRELLVYLGLYMAISLIYRFQLIGGFNPETNEQIVTEEQKMFEKVVLWFKNSRQMPLTFLLGFYVSLVVKRWWEQYIKLPWPDEVATLLKAGITKGDQEGDKEGENQRIRRTVIRYLMLSYVLCLRRISSKVRKEYPDVDCLLESGLLRKDERQKLGDEDRREIGTHGRSNWWMPIKWSISIIRKAMNEDRFANAPSYSNTVKAIAAFRKGLTDVVTYGHVTVPLVYTQVVHLAVYFYFAVSLLGRQWIQVHKKVEKVDANIVERFWGAHITDPEELDLYFPIFLTFEFLFYMGWLKVASALYNPFGDDDDDFAVMDKMNRHIKVCMKIVEEDDDDIPEVMDDDFWKPPNGGEPRLDQKLGPPQTKSALEVVVVDKPDYVRNESVRKWSEASKAIVEQKQVEEEEGEPVCVDPGQVALVETRDPGKAAVC